MHALSQYFHAQACNNAWANLRLLRACAALDDGEFAASRVGFFPSLQKTLNHIVTMDWFFVDALERTVAGLPANPNVEQFFNPSVPFLTCKTLVPAQHTVDRRLIALCSALTTLDLTVSMQHPDHMQHEPLVRVLAHLFQHQIHHRGQAHAMLSSTRIPPPQLDELYLTEEAPLRAEELATLGLTEADIWPTHDPRP